MSQSNFDYIIVGAGVAGCTLAAEITRRTLGSVLLLEAGGPPNSIHLKVPSQYPLAFHGRHSWGHTTVAQPNLANRRIAIPVGRTLGGSSAINAMIWLRGHVSDFRSWQSKLGSDWCPDQVERAYHAIEQATGILETPAPSLHEVIECFLEGAGQSVPVHKRLEGPQIGVGPFVRCQTNGRRRSAWDLWLKHRTPAVNTMVRTDTMVEKIVFDFDRAVGVQVKTPVGIESIRACKGVLLCAGAIHSPRILLASGIGDDADLRSIGCTVVCKSPRVGMNLHDHLVYPIVHELRSGESLRPFPNSEDRIRYLRDRTGPRSSNIAELGGLFAWDGSETPTIPDYQWHVTPTHYLEYPHRANPTSAISMGVTVLQPKSRGSVRLVSSESEGISNAKGPFSILIDPAYLAEESDMDRFIRSIEQSRMRLAEMNLKSLLGTELLPGEKRTSEEQLAKSIARFATTIYHYVGSCSMGPSVAEGVVDSRFKVHGVDGLWVCDASVMPTIVSANPQATVMMMAHRLASWL